MLHNFASYHVFLFSKIKKIKIIINESNQKIWINICKKIKQYQLIFRKLLLNDVNRYINSNINIIIVYTSLKIIYKKCLNSI